MQPKVKIYDENHKLANLTKKSLELFKDLKIKCFFLPEEGDMSLDGDYFLGTSNFSF